MTDTDERRLREALHRLDPGPGDLSASGITALGRRRRRRRRVRGAAVSAVVALLAAAATVAGVTAARPAPVAPPTVGPTASPTASPTRSGPCTVEQRPDFGRGSGGVTAADADLRYVAAGDYVWHDGVRTRMHTPPGTVFPSGINASGVVVGGGFHIPGGDTWAWIYRDGEMSVLPVPAGYPLSGPAAINASGVVVGSVGNQQAEYRPVRWIDGRMSFLPLPAGESQGMAADIADDGTVIGNLDRLDATHPQPYVWPPSGAGRRLSVPAGATGRAMTLRGDFVYGVVTTDPVHGKGNVAARWRLSTGHLDTWPHVTAWEVTGDAAGDVLARGRPDVGPPRLIRADGTPPIVLPTPTGVPGNQYPSALAISADGHTIVGRMVDIRGIPVPDTDIVFWHC